MPGLAAPGLRSMPLRAPAGGPEYIPSPGKVLRPPARLPVGVRTAGQAGHLAAIAPHHINLIIAIPERSERDPLPIRRVGWRQVVAPVRELAHVAAVDRRRKNIAVAHRAGIKGDPPAVGRPVAAAPGE